MSEVAVQVALFAIGIICSIIGAIFLLMLNSLQATLREGKEAVKDVTDSINQLNIKMGVIVEKNDRNEKDIDKLKVTYESVRVRLHDLGNHINELQLAGLKKVEWAKTNKEMWD